MLPIYKDKRATKEEEAPLAQINDAGDGTLRLPEGGNRIHFISLGCPRNLVDTEVMIGIVLRAGYEATGDVAEADYVVINTCGFLEAARKESSQTMLQCRQEAPDHAKIIVTGCMVQNNHETLQQQFPFVDYFLGSGDVEHILTAISSQEKGSAVTAARSYLEAGEVPRKLSTPRHYAYLKIAEGCRKKCSYCIIPNIKGPLKSKSKEQIVKEFRLLLSQGVKEIILIAQDLGDYGKDQGWKKSEGLHDLLKTLLQEPGDYWLRMLYLYPDEMSDEIIDLMANDKRLCKYVDMPIQHIDDDMLKTMRRATNSKQIIEIIEKLRARVPGVVIRTSLIVGFPGETEEQFKALQQFLEKYPLDNVGIFKYSREAGSHADTLEGHLADNVKERRHRALSKTQQKVIKKQLSKLVGQTISVVVEGFHPETQMLLIGRHQGQCPEIDGQVLINDFRVVKGFGERYLVKITEVSGYDLVGKAIKSEK